MNGEMRQENNTTACRKWQGRGNIKRFAWFTMFWILCDKSSICVLQDGQVLLFCDVPAQPKTKCRTHMEVFFHRRGVTQSEDVLLTCLKRKANKKKENHRENSEMHWSATAGTSFCCCGILVPAEFTGLKSVVFRPRWCDMNDNKLAKKIIAWQCQSL